MAGTPDIDRLSTRDGYDRWASIYDDEDNPLIALEEPRIDALLGPVRGLSVADLGCGTGRHAVRLAAAGAAVTAFDFSEGMLTRARARPGAAAVTWVVHDLARAVPLADRAVDRVVCGLVLDHVADLAHFFREARRICRTDGRIVVSIMHPAMMLRGVQARFTDPETGRETRPDSQPHQVCDYVVAALGAGLRFDHLSEHAVDATLAARSPRAAKYLGWPMLLLMALCP
ncbi:MAG: class I SAM-dependent methyltransferase [Phycisphaerae bacterium]